VKPTMARTLTPPGMPAAPWPTLLATLAALALPAAAWSAGLALPPAPDRVLVAAATDRAAADDADDSEDADDADADEAPPARPARPARRASPVWRQGVDDLLLEAGRLGDTPRARSLTSVRASTYVQWQPSRAWEARAGLRLDGQAQAGGTDTVDRWRLDAGDTYLRWRGGDTRLTAGAQTIVWGRVDAVPPGDRVSRVDLTRFVLDELPQRRRSQTALRWEQSFEDTKLDLVLLPAFRGAALPALDSVWSPIDRRRGRVIGVAPTPGLAMLVQQARIVTDDGGGHGGAGLRITHDGEDIDLGLTLARTRASLPYFQADPVAAGGPVLAAVHPFQRYAGIDAEWTAAGATWRVELGHTDGLPRTRPDGRMVLVRGVDAVGGVELFPGGGNTRLSLLLVLRETRDDGPTLELRRYAGVQGELAGSFARDRWKAGLRFASGLNVHDLYLAPRISWVGWEPHEFYLALHHFRGDPRTLGGFHREHGLLSAGLRTRF
jgi:hypothetical protein